MEGYSSRFHGARSRVAVTFSLAALLLLLWACTQTFASLLGPTSESLRSLSPSKISSNIRAVSNAVEASDESRTSNETVSTEAAETTTEPPSLFAFPSTMYDPPELCKDLTYLTPLIFSHPDHPQQRNDFRTRLRHLTNNTVQPVFIFGLSGRTTDGEPINELALTEALKYRDIVIGNFSHQDKIEKVLFGLKWYQRCNNPTSNILFKVNVEMTVNWRNLLHGVEHIRKHGVKNAARNVTLDAEKDNLWLGARYDDMPIIHNKTEPFYDDIEGTLYPPYCSGTAYILNRKMVGEVISRRRQTAKMYRVDDAMIGLLMNGTGIEPTDMNYFIPVNTDHWRQRACDGLEFSSIEYCDCRSWWVYNINQETERQVARTLADKCLK